jgi:outer membrane cobalamin receptor
MIATYATPLILCCCLVLSDPTQAASDAEIEALFELSLEELLQLKVSVASSREETISETPAIVSRYEASDLSLMGLRTLKDFLSFVPGVLVDDSVVGHSHIVMRGISEVFNQKVLFLLDDVPYWMPSHSQVPLLGIPLESIDHIEIIRGPGAVIYGSNATSGVVKIITRKRQASAITFTAGNNEVKNAGGYIYQDFNAQGSINIAAEVQREEGFEGEIQGRTRSQQYESLSLDYVYNNMTIKLHGFEAH